MPERKVNLATLQALADEGKSQAQIAEETGWSKAAVCRNLKALSMARAQDIVFRHAGQIAEKKIDAMGQLVRINEAISIEMDKIHEFIKEVPLVRDRMELQEAQIKHSAEIRKQLSLLLEIGKTLYNVEEIEAFRKICLEEIGNESQDCKDRILKRLQSRRSSSGLVGFSESRI